MGSFERYFVSLITIAVISYVVYGFVMIPANLWLPAFFLNMLPFAWHEKKLWEVIVLENWPFWIGVAFLAAIYTGWKMNVWG